MVQRIAFALFISLVVLFGWFFMDAMNDRMMIAQEYGKLGVYGGGVALAVALALDMIR